MRTLHSINFPWLKAAALLAAASIAACGGNGGERDSEISEETPGDPAGDESLFDSAIDPEVEETRQEDPLDEEPPVRREWRILLEAEDEGIFSLIIFEGVLYAGTYGVPYIYDWDGTEWGRREFDCESIYDFEVHDGRLWSITEQEGAVRSLEADGSWTVTLDAPDPWTNGHALESFEGSLFATVSYYGSDPPGGNWTRIYRLDGSTWEMEYESESRCKGLVVYEGALYGSCYCASCDPLYGRLVRRSAPGAWEVIAEEPTSTWFEPAASFDGSLYLGGGVQGEERARIWRWDGGSGFEVALADVGAPAVYELEVIEGRLYAAAGAGWRTLGDALIVSTPDGTIWEEVNVFPGEAEGWALTGSGSDLFFGTRIQDGHGHVWAYLPAAP